MTLGNIFQRKTRTARFIARILGEFPGSRIAQSGCVNCRRYSPIDGEEWAIRFAVPYTLIGKFLQQYGDYVIQAARFTYPVGDKKGMLQDSVRVIIYAKGRVVQKRAADHNSDIRLPRTVEEYIENHQGHTLPDSGNTHSHQ